MNIFNEILNKFHHFPLTLEKVMKVELNVTEKALYNKNGKNTTLQHFYQMPIWRHRWAW